MYKTGKNRLPIIALFIVISFFHLWKISELPKGYYCDELSIGYNAMLIAETGHDEHDRFLPVFFEAFGEYKNPLYIYTVSLIYKVFGISEYALRFTSFLFFFFFLLGFYFLVKDVFRDNKTISIYLLLVVGFLPFFFALSRIAFEVISQLTTIVYSLLCIHRAYHQDRESRWTYSALAGFFLGLSVYSYSTARLLTFFLLLSLMLIYLRRPFLKTAVTTAVFFLLTMIPYIAFSVGNPGALVARFKKISYLYNSSFSMLDKIILFTGNYVSYFGFDFLLLTGDKNLRHSTGYGGELFFIVFILFAAGLTGLAVRRKLFRDKFLFMMFVNLLLSPVAGSLTETVASGKVPHVLRGVLLGLYVSFFSCYGLSYLLLAKNKIKRTVMSITVFALLVGQIYPYLNDYFTAYEEKTIGWFESFDFKSALSSAIGQNPEKIIVSNMANQPYVLVEFYKYFVDNPRRIPIYVADPLPMNNACIVYFVWNDPVLDMFPYMFRQISLPAGVVRVRCY
jgi:hypothetical protein